MFLQETLIQPLPRIIRGAVKQSSLKRGGEETREPEINIHLSDILKELAKDLDGVTSLG